MASGPNNFSEAFYCFCPFQTAPSHTVAQAGVELQVVYLTEPPQGWYYKCCSYRYETTHPAYTGFQGVNLMSGYSGAHTLTPTQKVEVRGVKEFGASLGIQQGCQKVKLEMAGERALWVKCLHLTVPRTHTKAKHGGVCL